MARLELSPDEWAGVIASAERHQVAGLLYWQLRSGVPEDQPPPDAMARLHGAYMAGAAQALLRERELRAVLSMLSEAGIIPTLFKGAVLARTVYPTAACRPMGDLDLWIDDAQMPRAMEALEAGGYTVARRLDRPLALQRVSHGEVKLVGREPGRGLIELHWGAFGGQWLRRARRSITRASPPPGADGVGRPAGSAACARRRHDSPRGPLSPSPTRCRCP